MEAMLRLGWVAAAALLTCCATMPPDAGREGARLMGELRMASGGAAVDVPTGFHETGVVVENGQTSTYETWGDFRALRWTGTHTSGGVTRASGFDGHIGWTKGADGTVHTDTSPAGLAGARLGAYLTIAAYFYPDRFPARFEYKGRRTAEGEIFDVVTVTPQDSVPIDFWLDEATHHLRRLVGMDGTTPFLGIVEREQIVSGVRIGSVVRQVDGEHDMAQTVTLYEFVSVPDARFSPPAH
jgi:hypothetical protein